MRGLILKTYMDMEISNMNEDELDVQVEVLDEEFDELHEQVKEHIIKSIDKQLFYAFLNLYEE